MLVRIIKDPLDFARDAEIRHGKIAVSELVRVKNHLFNDDGELHFHIAGLLDENEKPKLQVEIKGTMQLTCQRCLYQLTHNVDITTHLSLAINEVELHQTDADIAIDAILAISELNIFDLIEDEVLLSLPISARHAENTCNLFENAASNRKNLLSAGKSNTESPFAILASLKKIT